MDEEFVNKMSDIMNNTVQDGVIMGIEHAKVILNAFFDEKENKFMVEYITRTEMNTFMDEYIRNVKNIKNPNDNE